MIKHLLERWQHWFNPPKKNQTRFEDAFFEDAWSQYLNKRVKFYRQLDNEDKILFEQRLLLFLDTTKIEGDAVTVTNEDCLLIAASAIIPVWAYKGWHYFNLKTVHLLPASFNDQFACGKSDSLITGMVGTGPLSGKMVLSKPDLHRGFENAKDKKNVGIHEFVHLIDMADGDCDGFPESLTQFAFSIPWFDLVESKMSEIDAHKSNIRDYGATNRAEFLSVTSEYFFERPRMLKSKHPKLYAALSKIYKQDTAAIKIDISIKKQRPCPCGSGKKYKHCCMPTA